MYRVVIIFCIIFDINIAFATEYWSNSRKRLDVTISSEGINRIEFEKDRILKVVGQQEDYNIEGDSAKGFVFISTTLAAGEAAPVTIITENGLTQDLNLVVKEKIAPVSVVIKSSHHIKAANNNNINEADIETQVLFALQDVIGGNTKDFSFRIIDEHELKSLNFEVERASCYSSKNLTILKYEYLVKPAILPVFDAALAIAYRGNAIYVVSKI